MPRLTLDRVSLTLPGRPSPFSLAGLLPAFCVSAPVPALDNVDLALADGERLALAGASGSGKTSLLRLLAGRLPPTAGKCEVSGPVVAVVDVLAALDPEATGQQNLRRLAGPHAEEAAALAGIPSLLDVPVRDCSPGMRWRLGFAAAAARPGDVLLIDECVDRADIAFRPRIVHHLKQLLARARLAVVAEPALMVQCNRFMELARGRLVSLESTGRTAA